LRKVVEQARSLYRLWRFVRRKRIHEQRLGTKWQTEELNLNKKRLHKVIIPQGYNSHNTSILSSVYNLSTTCFGHCYCGHHQVGYNLSENWKEYEVKHNYVD
jgi:hypothetical protein